MTESIRDVPLSRLNAIVDRELPDVDYTRFSVGQGIITEEALAEILGIVRDRGYLSNAAKILEEENRTPSEDQPVALTYSIADRVEFKVSRRSGGGGVSYRGDISIVNGNNSTIQGTITGMRLQVFAPSQ